MSDKSPSSKTATMPAGRTAQAATIPDEALPYIRKFQDCVVVIKLGGSAMSDPTSMELFAQDLVTIRQRGMHPIVVHGGGPQIDEALAAEGKEPKFVDGLRVTDAESMRIVQKVLVGEINRDIVSLIKRQGGKAVGIPDKYDKLLKAKRLVSKRKVDLGMVGKITEVNEGLLKILFMLGLIPVIAPIGIGDSGQSYNINADTAASEIAKKLGAEKLVLLTNTEGVLDAKGKLISRLSSKEAASLISEQTIKGGMIPKVDCALAAVAGGVNTAHIIDGRARSSLLDEIFTESGVGTLISKEG